MVIMGKAVQLNRKFITILGVFSTILIIWMCFKQSGGNVNGNYKALRRRTKYGLYADGANFNLNGKPFRILSGAMHYFRIVPEHWEDRLLKLKAMGLNTVETYVPWNLHEEIRGSFNFEGQLDIVKFVKTAQKYGLYVIIRPGPYICAEWDLGGLPSWLLTDPKMEMRSLYKPFMDATEKFFDQLIPKLIPLQHSKGGPIIAWQVENEYLSYSNDSSYMLHLKNVSILFNFQILSIIVFTPKDRPIVSISKSSIKFVCLMLIQQNQTTLLSQIKSVYLDDFLVVIILTTSWKKANVSPIFKKGNKSLAENYRPVSLLPVISKVQERCVASRLVPHVKEALYPFQHGFQKGKSCVSQLLEVFQDIGRALDSGVETDIIYLDFAKAFDSVCPAKLVSKLKTYGIEDPLLSWFQSYLVGRKQRIVVNGTCSSWTEIGSGVQQGSLLGPVLFLLFINDMPNVV